MQKVKEIFIDEENKSKGMILLLKTNKDFELYMEIGSFESNHIDYALSKHKLLQPTIYNIIINVIKVFGAECIKVIITECKNNTFYSILRIKNKNGKEIDIDMRPSDAINIALRCDAPLSKVDIFISDNIIKDKISSVKVTETNDDLFDIEKIDPKDFEI